MSWPAAFHKEMLARGLNHVYLDLRSYIPRDDILAHFPTIYQNCLAYGVDVTEDLVPVCLRHTTRAAVCGWTDGATQPSSTCTRS